MKKRLLLTTASLFLLLGINANAKDTITYNLATMGLEANNGSNNSPAMLAAIKKINNERPKGKHIIINLPQGRYDFYPEGAAEKDYYISNHDQTRPKSVAMPFEDIEDITFEGNGADLIFMVGCYLSPLSTPRTVYSKIFISTLRNHT